LLASLGCNQDQAYNYSRQAFLSAVIILLLGTYLMACKGGTIDATKLVGSDLLVLALSARNTSVIACSSPLHQLVVPTHSRMLNDVVGPIIFTWLLNNQASSSGIPQQASIPYQPLGNELRFSLYLGRHVS
jgi:hypothetical protein